MANVLVNETALHDIADAIREKNGSQDTYKPSEMADAISDIESEVTGGTVDELAMNTWPSGAITITTSEVKNRAFANKTGITSVNMPNCTTINATAFADCTGITSVNAPSLTTITGSYNFQNCTSLATFNAPNLTSGNSSQAFANTIITNVHFENLTLCNSLLQNMKQLVTAVLPNSVNNYAGMTNCTKLQKADIKGGDSLTNAFSGCTVFDTLVIRNTARIPLSNVNCFNNTKFKSGGDGGTIYIYKSLYDELGTGSSNDYKAATNWSTVDGYGTITWAPIEGSYYETHYVDDTEIPTE